MNYVKSGRQLPFEKEPEFEGGSCGWARQTIYQKQRDPEVHFFRLFKATRHQRNQTF